MMCLAWRQKKTCYQTSQNVNEEGVPVGQNCPQWLVWLAVGLGAVAVFGGGKR